MINWRGLVRITSLLVALLLLSRSLPAQPTRATDAAQVPIESRLNPDGTLKLGNGFTGTLDLRGWRMQLAPDGSPRFVRASVAKEREGLLSTSGDEGWDTRFGPAGVSGDVYAIAISGSDVYIGGHFTVAGDLAANNIVRWNSDSRTWSPLGRPELNGVGGAAWAGHGSVTAICAVGEDVYVGGLFESAGDQFVDGIARWNKSTNQWYAVGSGVSTHLEPSGTSRGGDVYAIIQHGTDIYIAGRFFKAGSAFAGNIARWDGSRWNILGQSSDSTNGHIYAMAFYGNDLYIGGSFSQLGSLAAHNMAKYTPATATWSTVPNTPDSTVYAMTVANNLLYIGGEFRTVGSVQARHIASWNGSNWSGLGTSAAPGTDSTVRTIISTPNGLVVGGDFQKVEGILSNGVARWSNASWTALSSGVSGLRKSIYTLASSGASIYAGGSFAAAGAVAARNVARWDSTAWTKLTPYSEIGVNRNGTDRGVYAVALHGADVYVGGDFTVAGGFRANYVAKWNSNTNAWSSLGSGIGGTAPFVRSLAFKGDTLFVGGIFTTAGGQDATGIAKWDGAQWYPVGGGVGGSNPFVFAMNAVGSDLYVAGAFTTAGGQPANRIAKWTGSGWQTLGDGIGGAGYSYITALASFGSNIYVGGEFTTAGAATATRVAKWDGTTWSALGTGVNAPVSALAVGNGGTYVGGDFTSAGGNAIPYLALWNGGSWVSVAAVDGPVRSIMLDASQELIIGGEFTHVDGTLASSLAMKVSSGWKIFGPADVNGVNGPVRAIALNTQYIYTGGEFAVAGGVRANNIAQWDGNSFSSLGSDASTGLEGPVLAIAIRDSSVYAGGMFSATGGLRANGIAMWNGYTWSRVGGGFDGTVRALAIAPNGDLYAGGDFTKAEGNPAAGIAVWNGTSWSSLAGGVGGSFPTVSVLAVGGNNIYVGGKFSTAGGLSAHRIAKWSTTSRSWSTLGDGIGGASDFTFINALAARNDTLYAGGVFASAGGVAAQNLARWDGTGWTAIPGGVDNTIYALAIGSAGELYVGGDFSFAGQLEAHNMAIWSGGAWQNMGEGIPGQVYAISVGAGGMVYVGGTFAGAGIFQSGGIVRWDGHSWQGLGSGVSQDSTNGSIAAIGISGDNIYVGGDFTLAGGKASMYFGRWNTTLSAVPYAAQQAGASALIARTSPNPFHGSTTFTFTLPKSGFTTLKVYDAGGIEVGTVAEGQLEAGAHDLRWEAGDLPSGVYYYRLQQEGNVIVRPVVLCR